MSNSYADDVAIVIVAKHIEEIKIAFNITFERISRWMKVVNLLVAIHKTQAVLISSRKQVETVTLRLQNKKTHHSRLFAVS